MNLRSRVLSGMYWMGGMRFVGQIISWAITIVVVRLLTPGDYGLLAMATVFMTFLSLVAEAGLGPALVRELEVTEILLRRSFGVIILINSVLFVIQFAAAPLIATFFDENRLVLVLRVLGFQFLIATLSTIPAALLMRSLDFKRQSLINFTGTTTGSLITLAMALSGQGVWALVAGMFATQSIRMVGLNIVAPFWKLPNFSFVGIGNSLLVSSQITAQRGLTFLSSQADVFIAGKFLGKELLGTYSTSLHLASLPVQKISAIVNQVAFPAFAEAQRKPESVPRYLLKVVRVLSFFSFPVLWGISCIAPEIVTVLLGPKWEAARVPLQLLPLVMPIRMLGPVINSAFQGIGRTGAVLKNAATLAVIMPIAFLLGTQGGLLGLSLAWLIGYPFAFWLNLWRMMPLVSLKPSDIFAAMAWPTLGGAVMYGSVAVARYLISGNMPPSGTMVVLILVGATVYLMMMVLTNRTSLHEVLDLLRGV